MSVILTSFTAFAKIDHNRETRGYSVARYQPQGFALPWLPFLAACNKYAFPLKLRHFTDPLTGYPEEYSLWLQRNWKVDVRPWLDSLDNTKDIYLCCWCPYSKTSQLQLMTFGTFACHTGLIAKMIAKHRPDIDILFDEDREKHLVPSWKPIAQPIKR